MPHKLMVVTVDDHRDSHVVPFRPAACRGLFSSAESAGSPHCPPPTSPTSRRGVFSPRPRSYGTVPMYARLAELPSAGLMHCGDESQFPVLSLWTHDVS